MSTFDPSSYHHTQTQSDKTVPLPPPAPPLPPSRLSHFQRFIGPLGFNKTPRHSEDHDHDHDRDDDHGSRSERPPIHSATRSSGYGSLSSQTPAHRTGIPIAALDINEQRTHAVLAGKEILKTVRIQDGKVSEDFNLRSSIISYASTHGDLQADAVNRRREYLPARDVRWSSKTYSHIIATAAQNGRISLYDVNVAGSRTELAWVHDHTGQVNKIDFDIFVGYLMLSGSSDKTVRMWDIRNTRSPRCTQKFDVRSGVRHVAWSPVEGNDFEFALCADGGLVQHWDARNPKGPTLSIHAHDRGCYSLDWHPDGRHVVSGGFDKFIRVWNLKGERRQKPTFNIRAPQAIRIVKWRPPCWSSETAETGAWQTTQIATTYSLDDPRLHVWDLRRPRIPFREIDMYNRPATDFLWASKDLIWTCGEEGMFTQNDINIAPQMHQQHPPCEMEWLPDGDNVIFSEERVHGETFASEDSSAAFLNVAPETLSQNDGFTRLRNPDEDDPEELAVENLLSTSFKRQGRGIPTKSPSSVANLSHAASPQTPDNLNNVVQLDRAVHYSSNTFQNSQTGCVAQILGATTEGDIVEFLANYYTPPPSESQRKKEPGLILSRLKACFLNNAEVCDEASMHRIAQSWRMLEAVIIPELTEWADGNRAQRKAKVMKLKEQKEEELRKLKKKENSIQSFSHLQARNGATASDTKPQKFISNLFRNVTDPERPASDHNSSSTMTTPLARPVSGSPRPRRTAQKHGDSEDLTEGIDNLQALPPSLLHSHTTAAAAARALVDNASISSNTPPTSPEKRNTEESAQSNCNDKELQSPQRIIERSPMLSARIQEERRAALRDYRVQARPIFTLDAPIRSPQYGKDERHDSSDSFPMFSISTSSSHKTHSLDKPELSPGHPVTAAQPRRGLPPREDSMDSISSLEDDSRQKGDNVQIRDFSDSPTDPSFGKRDRPNPGLAFDGSFESKEEFEVGESSSTAADNERSDGIASGVHHSTLSSSPELFHFEAGASPPQTRIHMTNPILNTPPESPAEESLPYHYPDMLLIDAIETDGYHLTDFRPIDLSKYNPRLPFAFSALPLACQMIVYDAGSGVACGQFAAYLLLYLAPYFFHPVFRTNVPASSSWPRTMAERLMRPDLSHRILEGVLLEHIRYLGQKGLNESAAGLRKVCAELGFEKVFSSSIGTTQESSISNGDIYAIPKTCSSCGAPMEGLRNSCARCLRLRAPCPLCETIKEPNDAQVSATSVKRPLWVYCQACGHGTHSTCMQEWLALSVSEGRCPTVGCGCDCAPGQARKERMAKQRQAHEESKLIGGRLSSTKKDSFRAIQSPAVDKTRAALRASSGERGTQSSDERGKPGRRSSARQSAGGFASSRKSVRLVTPGEETSSRSTITAQTNEVTRIRVGDKAEGRG